MAAVAGSVGPPVCRGTRKVYLLDNIFKKLIKLINLFLAALGLRCGAWASQCGGFSCCRARALGARVSVVVVRELCSCGSRALEHRLSSCGAQA